MVENPTSLRRLEQISTLNFFLNYRCIVKIVASIHCFNNNAWDLCVFSIWGPKRLNDLLYWIFYKSEIIHSHWMVLERLSLSLLY